MQFLEATGHKSSEASSHQCEVSQGIDKCNVLAGGGGA